MTDLILGSLRSKRRRSIHFSGLCFTLASSREEGWVPAPAEDWQEPPPECGKACVMASSLEAFLEQARVDGQVESTGEFSLDAERAKRLMGQFQMADPAQYLLKIAQAALCARANQLSFVLDQDETEIRFEGHEVELFDTYQVMAAMSEATNIPKESALAHLAVGLNAAAAQDPESIVWTAWSAWRPERLIVASAGLRFEKLTSSPWPGSRGGYQIVVRHRKAVAGPEQPETFWERLKRTISGMALEVTRRAREHALLHKKLTHFPLVVKVDGRTMDRPKAPHAHQQTHYSGGGYNVFRLPEGVPKQALQAFKGKWRDLKPGNWGGVMAVAEPTSVYMGLAQVTFFHFGVRLNTLTRNLGWPGVVILASTEGLDVDLSESGVVDNQKLKEFFKHLREEGAAAAGTYPPILPYIDESYLPEAHSCQVELDEDGLLVGLTSPAGPKLWLDQAAMSGTLNATAWPHGPPIGLTAQSWSRWARGAVDYVVCGGFVKFTEQHLKGPFVTEGDGIRANFYDDGQLKSLACYRDGEPLGWMLELDHGLHSGRVTHADSKGWNELYEGSSSNYSGAPWSKWVGDYITAIYKDFLL